MRAEQLVAAARPPSPLHWSQQTSLTTLHSSLHHTAAAAATNPSHCYGAGPGDVMSDAGIIPTFTHLYFIGLLLDVSTRILYAVTVL